MASKQPRGVPKYPCLLDDVQRWVDINETKAKTLYLMNRFQTTAPVALGLLGSVTGGVDVQAAVVEWQGNIVIPADIDGLYIKVDTQQTFAGPGSGLPGWDLNPYSATALTWFNATGTGMMRYPGVTTGSAGSLVYGSTVIGPDGSFGSGSVVVGSAPGNWRLNDINYFGYRFIADDGQLHYGWGSAQVGATILDRTLLSLTWETIPNTPIFAGSLVTGQPAAVPETSTIAAGALAGLAVGARFVLQRRRRATAQQACSVEA